MSEEYKKVFFDAKPYTESAWIRIENGQHILANIPFYAYGYAEEDVLTVRKDEEGVLWAEGVLKASGNSTIRILLKKFGNMEKLCAILKEKGCTIEKASATYVAVTAPPIIFYPDIVSYLSEGRKKRYWIYEEGCISLIHRSQLNEIGEKIIWHRIPISTKANEIVERQTR